mmetsp:Transcript_13164/g.32968  ORF Transcript_13164/g.32968 Transcript_13164/m.32968 type:complete len:233 (-) Transcript_13164:335-1033(-)
MSPRLEIYTPGAWACEVLAVPEAKKNKKDAAHSRVKGDAEATHITKDMLRPRERSQARVQAGRQLSSSGAPAAPRLKPAPDPCFVPPLDLGAAAAWEAAGLSDDDAWAGGQRAGSGTPAAPRLKFAPEPCFVPPLDLGAASACEADALSDDDEDWLGGGCGEGGCDVNFAEDLDYYDYVALVEPDLDSIWTGSFEADSGLSPPLLGRRQPLLGFGLLEAAKALAVSANAQAR